MFHPEHLKKKLAIATNMKTVCQNTCLQGEDACNQSWLSFGQLSCQLNNLGSNPCQARVGPSETKPAPSSLADL